MKKFWMSMLVAVVATSFEDNFPLIRKFTYGPGMVRRYDTIEVRKFEDTHAICYVATNSYGAVDGISPQPTISCVKR